MKLYDTMDWDQYNEFIVGLKEKDWNALECSFSKTDNGVEIEDDLWCQVKAAWENGESQKQGPLKLKDSFEDDLDDWKRMVGTWSPSRSKEGINFVWKAWTFDQLLPYRWG